MKERYKILIFVAILLSLSIIGSLVVYDWATRDTFDAKEYVDNLQRDFMNAGIQVEPAWITIKSESKLFDFSNIVLENGSVNKTVEKRIIIIVNNTDNIKIEDMFVNPKLFPDELKLRSVDLILSKGSVGNLLFSGGSNKLDKARSYEIGKGKNQSFDLILKFKKSPKYTFQDNVTYNCVLEFSQRYCCGYSTTYGMDYENYNKPFQFNIRT